MEITYKFGIITDLSDQMLNCSSGQIPQLVRKRVCEKVDLHSDRQGTMLGLNLGSMKVTLLSS